MTKLFFIKYFTLDQFELFSPFLGNTTLEMITVEADFLKKSRIKDPKDWNLFVSIYNFFKLKFLRLYIIKI